MKESKQQIQDMEDEIKTINRRHASNVKVTILYGLTYEISTCEMSTCGISMCEISMFEVSTYEIFACEVSVCEIFACEIFTCEIFMCEIFTCENSVLWVYEMKSNDYA